MRISVSSRSKWLRGAIMVLLLATCIILVSCSGNATVDTSRTFDASDFSETNARETLELAVRNECSKSNVGITAGLTSALRIVASAPAIQRGDNWEFSYDQKTALVTSCENTASLTGLHSVSCPSNITYLYENSKLRLLRNVAEPVASVVPSS